VIEDYYNLFVVKRGFAVNPGTPHRTSFVSTRLGENFTGRASKFEYFEYKRLLVSAAGGCTREVDSHIQLAVARSVCRLGEVGILYFHGVIIQVNRMQQRRFLDEWLYLNPRFPCA